jgi:hypothetical protein
MRAGEAILLAMTALATALARAQGAATLGKPC